MIFISALLEDASLAGFVSAVLSILIVIVSQLDEYRWGRQWDRKRTQRDRRRALVVAYYARRPTRPIYDLVPHMALARPISDRRKRFASRARTLDAADERMADQADRIARQWLGSVGEFARRSSEERLPLRVFLATYHLGVMREGAVAVPIAARLLAAGQLSHHESEQLFWGMALLDLAGDYNSIARQQRQAVYYEEVGHHPPIGPVRVPPSRLELPLLNLRDVISTRFVLRRWRYWVSKRWLNELAANLAIPGEQAVDVR